MKESKKSWIFYTLMFSNLVIYLVILALWISIPNELTLNLSITFFNLCFSLLLIIKEKEQFEKIYTSKKFKKISEVIGSSFLIFCILCVINHLFYKNPKGWDLTKYKQNSLSPETVNILNNLESLPEIFVFSRKQNKGAIEALFNMYKLEKSGFKISYIDAELRPDLLKKFHISKVPTILFKNGFREKRVFSSSEAVVTNALVTVMRKKDPLIYYSMGHQEADPFERGKDGVSHLIKLLEKSLFQVRPIHLASLEEIPEKVDSLIIWGPREGFHENELKTLDLFLKRGGKLLIGMDPDFGTTDKLKNLRNLISNWGLKINNDLVVDSLNHYAGSKGSIPLIKKFSKDDPLTKDFKGPLFFPLVSSIEKGKDIGGKYLFPVKTTNIPASWAEKTKQEVNSGRVTFNSGVDKPGPISVVGAWESEKLKKQTKIYAFGNTSFVVNGYANFGQNFAFFLRGISWLHNGEKTLSFTVPKIKDAPVFISSPQLGVIFYFSVLFVPLMMFSIALFIYRRSIRS